MKRTYPSSLWALTLLLTATPLFANDPVTLKNVKDPGPTKLTEPLAKRFSLKKAVHFLDSASLHWQKKRGCFSCHTNYAYMYARPLVSPMAPAHQTVRRFAEELVTKRWPKRGPRWDAEVIASAASLAFNDSATTGKLHPVTKTALDRMWTVQRKDGGWDWLKCAWPPMEIDDHYGVTLAAIAVGVAPGNYAQSKAAQKGLQGIQRYLKNHPSENLHQEAMILWASSYLPQLMTKAQQQACIKKLFALQKKDGGWNLTNLGNWKRGDKKKQDAKSSDGYATGFTIYVLRRAGIPAGDKRIQRGIAWLKANQRQSGRWITRSQYRDRKHYISHAASAFALMALAECRALH